MYYGPNYDPSSASVLSSVSSSVSSPVSPSSDQPSYEESHDPGDDADDDDDDDDDWITPDNLHRACEQMGGATTASAEGVIVGCLTTDFSMQVFILSVRLSL